MWSVIADASTIRLVKATLAIQGAAYAGTGKTFTIGGGAPVANSITATRIEKTSLSGVVTTGTQNDSYSLAYESRYETATALADFAGKWSATIGMGTVTWTITSAGVLTGIRTTGCTYSGTISLRTEQKAVADVAITETCADVATQLLGVATASADKARINMAMTTSDEASAVVVSLVMTP